MRDDDPPSSSLDSSKQFSAPSSTDRLGDYDVHPDFAIEPATAGETAFRHSGWAARRRQVWEALKRVGSSGSVLQAFSECGSGCWVQHSASKGAYRLSCNCCRSRWCIPCGVTRAAKLRRSVKGQLADWQRVRFVTVSLRHSDTPLKDQLDRLQRSYNELRKRDVWCRSITGAASFVEVKVSERDGLWHVHAHILCVGGWIDQRELSREWHKITGDSSIVDVRLARSSGEVAGYVTKYVTKPLDSSVFAHRDRLDEAITALRGRRLCNGSGELRKISASDTDVDAVDDWHTIGRLDDLLGDARTGNKAAAAILSLLNDRRQDKQRAPRERPPSG